MRKCDICGKKKLVIKDCDIMLCKECMRKIENGEEINLWDYVPKYIVEYLESKGYKLTWGCVAACGYGGMEEREDGLYAVSCFCHPYSYFIYAYKKKS